MSDALPAKYKPAMYTAETMFELSDALADQVQGEIADVIADKGHCVLALAGGKTPIPFFHALRKRAIEWDDVTVTLTDERYVPLDHADSNEAMLRRELLVGDAAKAKFVGLYAYAETAQASLAKIALPQPIDIVVCGMGEDMHTLSWFPGADGLLNALSVAKKKRLAIVQPGILKPRITLTAAAVGEARHVHLLISGAAKKAALERAMAAVSVEEAPVKRLFQYHGSKVDVYFAETP